MKMKLLITVSIAAIAPVAMAQSSVTIFGTADVSIQSANSSVANRTLVTTGHGDKLGFIGLEDLGGGLKAGFWLESAISMDNGTGGSMQTNNQASGVIPGGGGLSFSRRSTISLLGNWGEIRLGRDLMPGYWNIVLSDPWYHAALGAAIPINASVGGVSNTWVRASNAIQYLAPANLGGFYGSVGYFLGENVKNGAATEKDGTGYSVRVGYEKGPLNLGLGYMHTAYAVGDVTNKNLLATYDFKVAKLFAGYLRDTIGGANPDGTGWNVGVTAPAGSGYFRAAYSVYRTDAPTAPETKKLALGYVYNFSKQTSTYLTLADVRNSGGASQALAGSVAGPNGSSRGFEVGIKKMF